jgi:hypothetical protein
VKQDEVKQDEVKQDEVKQDEVKQKNFRQKGKYNKRQEYHMKKNMKAIREQMQRSGDSKIGAKVEAKYPSQSDKDTIQSNKEHENNEDYENADADADTDADTYIDNSNRPFVHALKVYRQECLLPEIERAKTELDNNEDPTRYARIRLNLFTEFVEVDVIKNSKEENKIKKKHIYPLHVLHYGPIIKNRDKIEIDSEDPEFIKATHFCWRDNKIWLKVNSEGKKPGGDGFGYDNTACAPFRDIQVELRDKGYYLQDLSKHYLDKETGKWQYRIDIRLYKSTDNIKPISLWHKYGMIPGLGAIKKQETTYVARKIKNKSDTDSFKKSESPKPKFSQYIDVKK